MCTAKVALRCHIPGESCLTGPRVPRELIRTGRRWDLSSLIAGTSRGGWMDELLLDDNGGRRCIADVRVGLIQRADAIA